MSDRAIFCNPIREVEIDARLSVQQQLNSINAPIVIPPAYLLSYVIWDGQEQRTEHFETGWQLSLDGCSTVFQVRRQMRCGLIMPDCGA